VEPLRLAKRLKDLASQEGRGLEKVDILRASPSRAEPSRSLPRPIGYGPARQATKDSSIRVA
jgi:hypothetical protein